MKLLFYLCCFIVAILLGCLFLCRYLYDPDENKRAYNLASLPFRLLLWFFICLGCLAGTSFLIKEHDKIIESDKMQSYVEQNYTFYIDGTEISSPQKLVFDNYHICSVDEDKKEVVIEKE